MLPVFFLITGLLCLIYCLMMLLYVIGWLSIPDFTTENSASDFNTSISVIIAARNEAENLPALLNCLAQQDYPAQLFEVIVVDDHSEDDTAGVVLQWAQSNVRLIRLSEHVSDVINAYKKRALSIGVAAAKGKLIVTTDADCTMGPKWLSTMAGYFEKHQPQMMVMPVVMKAENNGLGIFQLLDFMSLQGITGASIRLGVHGMCNGANLAYTRNTFDAVNGFSGIDNIASGDDLLLLQKVKQKFSKGIHYVKSTNVIVETLAQSNLKAFIHQRIRWAGKAGHYPDKSMLPVLLMVYLFNLSLLLCGLLAVAFTSSFTIFQIKLEGWQCLSILLLCKTIGELFFLWPVAGFFNRKRYLLLFPFFQPFHILYTVVAGALGGFSKYEWKGRAVK